MDTIIFDAISMNPIENPLNISNQNSKSKKKKKKNKCHFCKHKLTLINFDCRCKKTFCLTCKNPEIHNCTYNYFDHSKKLLENKLVKVSNAKIILI